MRIPAFALIASLALVASPALAAQSASGADAATSAKAKAAKIQNLVIGKFSPKKLSRAQIMKVQTALDKAGFNAGSADGRWGTRTQKAGLAFLKRKHKTSVSQLTDKDLASLGLNRAMFMQGAKHYGSAKGMIKK